MSTIKDADQTAIDIGELMGQAMAGPAKPREVPSPSDVDPEAPFGRGDDGTPNAPYGWTKPKTKEDVSRPKLTPGGRKPAGEARVAKAGKIIPPQPKPPADHGGKPALDPKDYTTSLAETSEALWVGLSMASLLPLEKTPVIGAIPVGKGRRIGDYLKGLNDRIAAQAHIFNANRGALVGALNLAANNSARARRLADKLETGDATWVLMCGAMVMPFMNQTLSLWTNSLADDGLPTVEHLATANKATMDAWITRFNSQLEAATAEAAAEAEAALAGTEAAA